jgi:S-DNA-T family DNA segregation ATPase FtsK/SpoIIIE
MKNQHHVVLKMVTAIQPRCLYDQCVSFVLETRKASTSSLQRKFSLGYNRAARIIDQMEENGIVSAMGANGKREILV